MSIRRTLCRSAAALCLLGVGAAPAFAHGGYYQGPKTPDGVPLPTGTPGPGGPLPRGGPITGPTYGPAVTGRKDKEPPATTPTTTSLPPAFVDPPVALTSWERWWAVHRERFLRSEPKVLQPLDITPSSRDPVRAEPPRADERVVAALRKATHDSSADVRASAALALVRAEVPDAGADLRRLAGEDPAPDVQSVALLCLGALGDPGSVPFLHGIVSDAKAPDSRRALAAVALGMCGGADGADLLAMTFDFADERVGKASPELQCSVLVGLGAGRRPEALPALRAALANTGLKAVVRSCAVTGLGACGDRESIDAYVKLLLGAEEVSLRQAAALALGRVLTIEDVTPINALLYAAKEDRDLGTQSLAVLALGGIRGAAVRDQLLQLFAKSADNDKPWRALALGLQGDAAAGATLRTAYRADDHEESLQGAYSIALGLLGDTESRDVLVREIGRRERFWSPQYASQAAALLHLLDAAGPVHERLVKATDPRQAAALATALCMLGDERGEERMAAVVRAHESVFATCTAAMALGTGRATASLPLLLAAASDGEQSQYARACAVSAIGRIVEDGEVPALAELLAPQNHMLDLDVLVLARELLDKR